MIKRLLFLVIIIFITFLTGCNDSKNVSIDGYVFSNTFFDNSTSFVTLKYNDDIKLTSNGENWIGVEKDKNNKLIVVGTTKFDIYVNYELEKEVKSMVIKTTNDININNKNIEIDKETKIDVESSNKQAVLSIECSKCSTIEIISLIYVNGDSYEATNRKKFTIIPTYDLINIEESKNNFKINDGYEIISVIDNKSGAELNASKYELNNSAVTINYYATYNYEKIKCERVVFPMIDSSGIKHIFFNNYRIV